MTSFTRQYRIKPFFDVIMKGQLEYHASGDQFELIRRPRDLDDNDECGKSTCSMLYNNPHCYWHRFLQDLTILLKCHV